MGRPESSSNVLNECKKKLVHLRQGCNLSLRWVRGHSGHELNEAAGRLSKEGTTMAPESMVGCHWNKVRERAEWEHMRQWEERYDGLDRLRQTKDLLPHLDPNLSRDIVRGALQPALLSGKDGHG